MAIRLRHLLRVTAIALTPLLFSTSTYADEILDGYMQTVVADYADGRVDQLYHFRSEEQYDMLMELSKERVEAMGLRNGDRIRLKAKNSQNESGRVARTVKPGEISAEDYEIERLPLEKPEIKARTLEAAQLESAEVNKERHVLFIALDFNDRNSETDMRMSQATLDVKMFTSNQSVNAQYQAASYGEFNWAQDTNGDGQGAVDRVVVSFDSNVQGQCDYENWASEGKTKAAQAGFDLGKYQHFALLIPYGHGCGWAGLADLDCAANDCHVWIGYDDISVFAHELGHNLGLGHAGIDADNDNVIEDEYGDSGAMMGYAGQQNQNISAASRNTLGYFETRPDLEKATFSSGTFSLQPIQANSIELSNHIQSLRVFNPDMKDFFTLEYSIKHTHFNPRAHHEFKLKVMYQNVYDTGRVAVLSAGESFRDEDAGITIELQSANMFQAQVKVSYDQEPELTTLRIPAEAGATQGTAYDTQWRSPEAVVAALRNTGDSLLFSNLPASTEFSLQYVGIRNGTITVKLNGEDAGKLQVRQSVTNNSYDLISTSMKLDIPEDSDLKFEIHSDDTHNFFPDDLTLTLAEEDNQSPIINALPLRDNFVKLENIDIEINASDTDGEIKEVALYLTKPNQSEQLVQVLQSGPYHFKIPKIEAGSHKLRAVALDNGGASAEWTQEFNVADVESYFIVHKATGKKVSNCGPADGTETTVVAPETNNSCVRWEKVAKGSYFFLRSVEGNGYIRPRGLSNGIPIKLHPTDWTGSYTQWSYQDTEDGFGYLVNRQTSKFMYTDSEALMQESKNWKGDWSRWRLELVQ